ncbi:MAG: phosphatidylethanolamine N-methyltransferase family protein [Calditrichia bacterium]
MKLLLVLSVIWIGFEVLLARFKRSGKSAKAADHGTLRWLWVTIIISITAGVFAGMLNIGHFPVIPGIAYYSGCFLITAGLIIRIVAIMQLRQFFTVNVAISDNHQLIDKGMYKTIRHPSYLGALCSFYGLGLAFNSWLSLIIIAVPTTLAFLYRISVEEKELIKALGKQYESYRRRTKRLIPGIF